MNLQEARKVALEFIDQISPYCERVEVAGSVRRMKPEPGDIEIVAAPRYQERIDTSKLFPEKCSMNTLHERMLFLLSKGAVTTVGRESKSGATAPFSEKYYRINFNCYFTHYPVDLFVVTPPAQWGNIFAIRTGSADYSHWLVTKALQRGLQAKNGVLIDQRTLKEIPCTEEIDFFNALGIDMPLPEEREFKDIPDKKFQEYLIRYKQKSESDEHSI